MWLSRGLRLPSEASFCGVFPFRRMILPNVATFALHDHKSACFATGFGEVRYSLRSGNAPKRSGGQIAEGNHEAIRKYPRASINHRCLSTSFIAGAISGLKAITKKTAPKLVRPSCFQVNVFRLPLSAAEGEHRAADEEEKPGGRLGDVAAAARLHPAGERGASAAAPVLGQI